MVEVVEWPYYIRFRVLEVFVSNDHMSSPVVVQLQGSADEWKSVAIEAVVIEDVHDDSAVVADLHEINEVAVAAEAAVVRGADGTEKEPLRAHWLFDRHCYNHVEVEWTGVEPDLHYDFHASGNDQSAWKL